MRALLLLTGAPGSGKSTLIKAWGLKDYTICPDDLRLLVQAPQWNIDGQKIISQKNDSKVWKLLFQILEERMQRGEFTVIDATHSKRSDFNRYKKLIKKYRYRVYAISLRNVPIDVCKRRNAGREELKRVPEDVINKMYARFSSDISSIPNWVTVIKSKEQLDNVLEWKAVDFNKYNNVVHIGDVHGSYDALLSAFPGGVDDIKNSPNTGFVFVGDYLDRGTNNVDTLKFFLQIYDLPNVYLLEGNHEIWLWRYANDEIDKIYSKEFLRHTMPELNDAGIDKKEIRKFYRSLYQVLKYKYMDKNVLVCHSGIPVFDIRVDNTSTEELIYGVGKYEDISHISQVFCDKYNGQNKYLVHGHRNIGDLPVVVNDCVFNLDGRVEAGGHLRVVELSQDGFKAVEFKNNNYRKEFKLVTTKPVEVKSVKDLVDVLRNNPNINEKKFGNISSFNFNRNVFYKKKWNSETVKARGLFINTNTNEIVVRSYDKFFNLNERRETSLEALADAKFPANVYIKYNGFLGLLGYDSENDELVFASKSTINGQFVEWFKQIFFEKVHKNRIDELKKYLKNENKGMVFEVIDINHDKHIIKYDSNKLVLLDVIDRDIDFKKIDYNKLKSVAKCFGFEYKELGCILKKYDDLYRWLGLVSNDTSTEHIEGYVIEFADDFKVKVKTNYYKFWKMMRGILYKMQSKSKGQTVSQASLYNELSIKFWQFLKDNIDRLEGENIIDLRDEFYSIEENKNVKFVL